MIKMQSPESSKNRTARNARLILLGLLFAACPLAFAQGTAPVDAPDLTGKTSNDRFMTGPAYNPGLSVEAAQRGPETTAVPGPPSRPIRPGLDFTALLPFATLAIGASSIGVAMYMKKSKPA
jgi:hypothetical protein